MSKRAAKRGKRSLEARRIAFDKLKPEQHRGRKRPGSQQA